MNYFGDIRLGNTIDIKFTTVDAIGVPTVLSGTPVVSAYVGNGTTQLTAGITLTVDFDSVVGLNNVRVVASSGNGYATATDVILVITTGTVDGGSVVGYVIGSFSIENRSAVMPTTAARTLDVSAGGEAGIDWANVGSPTTSVGLTNTTVGIVTLLNGLAASVITATSIAANAITDAKIASGAFTAAKFAAGAFDAVWSVAARILTAATNITSTGGTTVPQTGDNFARLGAPAGASVSADIAAVKVDTAAILVDTGTSGVIVATNNDKTGYGLSAAAIQAIWDALTAALTTVGSIGKLLVDNVNATISSRATQTSVDDVPTNAELDARTLLAADYFDPAADTVIVGTNNDKTGYSIGAGGIAASAFAAGAIDAASLAASAGQEIADEILNRDIAGGGSGNTRNVRNSLRAIRNRVDGSTGTLTVYEEDDTTPAWTAALTRTAGTDPITEVNP